MMSGKSAQRFLTGLLSMSLLGSFVPAPALARLLTADPAARPDDPQYYRTLVKSLAPGDTLLLPSGTYGDRLNLERVVGTPDAWIVVTGPSSGAPATITNQSTCCNTVQLGGTSYVAIENLIIDSAGLSAIDGINAKGDPTHDIRIERCMLVGQGHDQGTVAISTKCPAWRWTIRGNMIVEAGTGLYLGNSDGRQPFLAGTIEDNLVLNTIGYNMEIKHQIRYDDEPWAAQAPAGPSRTVIRNNVFIKERQDWPQGQEGARPNVLVDPFPDSGPGSTDLYEIYGNLFYRNPDEALLQATGRISVHDNIFVASGAGQASVVFTDHNGPLRVVRAYNNTIYSVAGAGIRFMAPAREGALVEGNLILTGADPLNGPISKAKDNVVRSPADAARYVAAPSESLGAMNFYPQGDGASCTGTKLDTSAIAGDTDYDRDFNGTPKGAFTFRGAYAGRGENPGWRLRRGLKTESPERAEAATPAPR